MRRATGRGLRGIGLLIAAGLLAGCLGDMPSSGPIGYGRENSVAPQGNFVRTIVSPPTPGADPLGIVRSFMTAASGDVGSFATARLYLAPEVRDDWRPQSEIRVVTDRDMNWTYDNLRSPGLVRFVGRQVARINNQGEYRVATQRYQSEFRLRLVDREWRISALPDGVTLSESELGRSHRSVSIFYPDRTRSILVPNQVYLPVRPALATSMVRALLRGPTAWLEPSVRSALPQGTTLQVDAVPIVDGIATVDLSENVARTSSSDRIWLSAQLVHTLRQISEIRGVRITAGGVPLAVPGMERTQPTSAWSGYSSDVANTDPFVYLSAPGGLSSLSLAASAALPRVFTSSIPDYTRGLRWPAVSHEGDRVAAVDVTGALVTAELSRVQGDEVSVTGLAVALPGSVGELLRPRWDLTATYWTAARGTRDLRAYAGRIGAAAVRVEAPRWGTGTITAFTISRDGARAAVARSEAGRSVIYLLRVVRAGREGELRLALEEPLRIAALYGVVTDLSWTSGTQVLALGGQPGLQRQVWSLGLDGKAPIAIGPPISAISIASAPGRSLIAETGDQRLVILRDQRWIGLTAGRDPAYSG